jgi:hypothetical protein
MSLGASTPVTNKPKIGIIGGGIVGRICTLSLNSEIFDIKLFDVIHSPRNVQFHTDPPSGPAAFPKGTRIRGIPGGEVLWGRNICAALFSDTSNWPELFLSKLNSICVTLEDFGFPKIKVQYISEKPFQRMIVKQTKPLFKLESRFNTAIDSGSVKFVETLIESISTEGQVPRVRYFDSSGAPKEEQFDYLVCASGPIGNFETLQKSGLLLKLPKSIYNHPSISIASVKYANFRSSGKWLFFPNKWQRAKSMECYIFTDKQNAINWTLRVFAPDTIGIPEGIRMSFSNLLSRPTHSLVLFGNSIKAALLGRLLTKSVNIELSADFRGGQMISIHDELDSKLQHLMVHNNGTTELEISEGTSSEIIGFIKKMNGKEALIKFYSDGVFRIPISDFSSSTHLMGLTPVQKTKNREPNIYDFSLENYPYIFLAGASTFYDSVPGHPTYLAASTAVYVADILNNRHAVK